MSSTVLLIIVGLIIVIAIITVIFVMLRRKSAQTPQAKPKEQQTTTINTEQASTPPPKFIEDPAGTEKDHLPTFEPLPQERPVTVSGDGDNSGKIRILIVDDNVQTSENVNRLLYFEDDMEVIGQGYTGREGVELAVKLRPHIVLMDINMPDMDGITATGHIAKQVPYSQVIIMSVQAEAQYIRQAMAAGARDYQPKPFTADELVNCIRRVYKKSLSAYETFESTPTQTASATATQSNGQARTASPGGDGPVIAVYSPKGGVGTSVIAANLAIVLQKTQGNVFLMDGDIQFGDIMVHLNVRSTRSIGHLANVDEVDPDLLSQILVPYKESGLQLLLAPPKPEMAELITPDMISSVLKHLKAQANAVVVDTSSRLSDQTLAIMDMADVIVLVTAPILPAVKSAKLFLDLADLLQFSSKQIMVVVNKANIANGIALEQLKQALRVELKYGLPYDENLPKSTNRGEPIIDQDSSASISHALAKLAEAVWARAKTPVEPAISE